MSAARLLAVWLGLGVVCFPGGASADPGDLDPSFGSGGKVRVSLSGRNDSAVRMVVQDDGKIVTIGTGDRGNERDLLLARFLADGSVDESFGDRGRVFFGFKEKTERGAAIALQSDGAIVVASQVEKGDDTARMLVARFKPDGSYDQGFGQKGRVTTAFDGTYVSPSAVLVMGGGEIVVGGEGFVGGLSASDHQRVWVLARYRADGRLDRSFGKGGRVVLPMGNGLGALVAQDDGKLVAGGSAGPGAVDFAVARLLLDGGLDATFGDGGIVRTSFSADNDYLHGLVIDSAGRIIAAGRSWKNFEPDVAVVRYLSDGTPDPSFGSDGKVTTDVGFDGNEAYGIVLGPDGRIVVAGWAHLNRQTQFALLRYREDGSLDPSFGVGGVVATPIGRFAAIATDVQLQGPDRIVACGWAANGRSFSDIVLARYEW